MDLFFIDDKGRLDENKLKKYVKRELCRILNKCDFSDCFVAPIMAEIIALVDSGKYSGIRLLNRIKKIFSLYEEHCNYSRDDLIRVGISSLYKYKTLSADEKEAFAVDFLSDFLTAIADNTSKYDITKGALSTYFVKGLDYFVKDDKEIKINIAFSLNDKVKDEDGNEVERGSVMESKRPDPEEVCEETEAREIAMGIAKEIWNNPTIVTGTAREVLVTFFQEIEKNKKVRYEDVDRILGKKPGTTSKNLKDLGDRVQSYLYESYEDSIGLGLIVECFKDLVSESAKAPFPGKKRRRSKKKSP